MDFINNSSERIVVDGCIISKYAEWKKHCPILPLMKM